MCPSGEERYVTLMKILLLSRKLGTSGAQLCGDRILIEADRPRPQRIEINPSEWALLSGGALTVYRSTPEEEKIVWQCPADRYVEKAVAATCFGRERQLVMLIRTLTAEKYWQDDHWGFLPGPRELTQHIWVTGRGAGGGAWRSLWLCSALDHTILDMTVSEKEGTVFLSTVEEDQRAASSGTGDRQERLYSWTGWAFQEYEEPRWKEQRLRMVRDILIPSGITDETVLRAACTIPRHLFVPGRERAFAYENRVLPIGWEQTIPEPSFMARLAQELHLGGSEKVLEIGTGSGYEAALLSRCAKEVYTIEIIPEVGRQAESIWRRLFLDNIHLKTGDGSFGWQNFAPYDAILVTAAPPAIPKALVEQLAEGGCMLIPCGAPGEKKVLWRVKKEEGTLHFEHMGKVTAVPMKLTDPQMELIEPPH
jgi:protein-L-isoaspartate(D-aspartate) O-methyltransferase